MRAGFEVTLQLLNEVFALQPVLLTNSSGFVGGICSVMGHNIWLMNATNSLTLPETGYVWTREPSAEQPRQYDYQLTCKFASGDIQAFEELYYRHHRRVFNLCHRMTNNVAEAEDLTQEVFIHLYHKAGTFRGEAAFTTWLHRLTINMVLMHFRSNKVRRDQPTADGVLPEAGIRNARNYGPALALDSLMLKQLIVQLPPGYRAAFILHDVEGYNHNETAQIMGISVGTTKSQLHKARKRLQSLLRDQST